MTVTDIPSGEPVSDRMQALLSRAVEEQVSEQRAASTVLADIKQQLAQLEAGVRSAAANDTVERLGVAVSTVVADQRTATTLVSQRLEALTRRLEELSALGEDVSAQAAALDRVQQALQAFGSFPNSLSALQREVSGLHDRLAPLADVQSTVDELAARSGDAAQELRPQLAALEAKLGAIGSGPDAEGVRDAVVDALAHRFERLQQAADRPVVGPDVLKSDLGDLRASLSAEVGEQLDPLRASLAELGGRLDRVSERVAGAGVAAGALAGLATDLTTLTQRVEALQSLKAPLNALADDVQALRADAAGTELHDALKALSDDVARLAVQVADVPSLSVEDIAAQVSARVADRLVETLAPRISDVVLTRVSAALVGQLAEAIAPRLAPQLGAQTDEAVRAATSASEARVLAHVDEGLLTLAETLLRRKPQGRAAAKAAPRPPSEPLETESVAHVMERLVDPDPDPEPDPEVAEPVAQPSPAPTPARPAVTTAMAPSPTAPAPVSAPVVRELTPARSNQKRATKPAQRPAPERAIEKVAEKAPARPSVSKAPAKKTAPRPRPQPLLERTPDLNVDDTDVEPVRQPAPPASTRPTPTPPPPPPAAAPPPRPLSAPPPTPSAPVRPADASKRKAWWRPGG